MTKSVTPDSQWLSPTEDERRLAEASSRLQSLHDLKHELDSLREDHAHLARQLREFQLALGVATVETTDEVVKAEADGA